MTPRRVLLAVVLVTGSGTACSTSESPQLHCDSRPAQVLAAQSVPSAAYVPCLGEIPEPWILVSTDSDQDRTVARLTWQDPAERSTNAAVALLAACAFGASQGGSSMPDIGELPAGVSVARWVEDGRTRTAYAFDGGCVEVDVPTDQMTEDGRPPFTVDLVPRADLDAYVLEETGGRVGLDPESS